jgi:hypothetical protein
MTVVSAWLKQPAEARVTHDELAALNALAKYEPRAAGGGRRTKGRWVAEWAGLAAEASWYWK